MAVHAVVGHGVHLFVTVAGLVDGDRSVRIITFVIPAHFIASIVLSKSLNLIVSSAETVTVPLFKWLTATKAASRRFVLRKGNGPSRVVPLVSIIRRVERADQLERERVARKVPKARVDKQTNARASQRPAPGG